MTETESRATSRETTRDPVSGLRPPHASVAPMAARISGVTSTAHARA
ncbi:hypothetical protein BC477_07090 [Clavibacter michiganensis subsp. michiganensis]|uniref:Uncharacterized protein n=1 Tax=Clavibacter michiganensis subsp. michiganensis TaxID=33013 RepID=A0A251XLX0_CLAMM|nr:hypothetical protein BC477_07090 [Clavibacter michiganensis subsp. michiganensis]OUE04482.1 hypothetical protein CMMCAS07_06020 [Clavibacter michiganensis subsp. michiganensis]